MCQNGRFINFFLDGIEDAETRGARGTEEDYFHALGCLLNLPNTVHFSWNSPREHLSSSSAGSP